MPSHPIVEYEYCENCNKFVEFIHFIAADHNYKRCLLCGRLLALIPKSGACWKKVGRRFSWT